MTDYQNLPPSVLEEPSVNTVAIAQIDLDARIAAAFADGAKSNDVAILIKDTEHAAASASEQAEQARNYALDPTLSGFELTDARKSMDDAAFRRDRLQAAIGKLRERLAELKDQEENARRQVAYDKAEAERDELAKELADLYPAFAQKLAELLARVAANDRRDRVHQWPCLAIRSDASARCRTKGTRPALGREQRRDAAHHRSAALASMAAALELSMATEKIVVPRRRRVSEGRSRVTMRLGAASDIRLDRLLRLKIDGSSKSIRLSHVPVRLRRYRTCSR